MPGGDQPAARLGRRAAGAATSILKPKANQPIESGQRHRARLPPTGRVQATSRCTRYKIGSTRSFDRSSPGVLGTGLCAFAL